MDRNDRNYCSFNVEIWEFKPIGEYDAVIWGEKKKIDCDKCVINEKQIIRQIRAEEL